MALHLVAPPPPIEPEEPRPRPPFAFTFAKTRRRGWEVGRTKEGDIPGVGRNWSARADQFKTKDEARAFARQHAKDNGLEYAETTKAAFWARTPAEEHNAHVHHLLSCCSGSDRMACQAQERLVTEEPRPEFLKYEQPIEYMARSTGKLEELIKADPLRGAIYKQAALHRIEWMKDVLDQWADELRELSTERAIRAVESLPGAAGQEVVFGPEES